VTGKTVTTTLDTREIMYIEQQKRDGKRRKSIYTSKTDLILEEGDRRKKGKRMKMGNPPGILPLPLLRQQKNRKEKVCAGQIEGIRDRKKEKIA